MEKQKKKKHKQISEIGILGTHHQYYPTDLELIVCHHFDPPDYPAVGHVRITIGTSPQSVASVHRAVRWL